MACAQSWKREKKKRPGSVRVYNKAIFQDLCRSSNTAQQSALQTNVVESGKSRATIRSELRHAQYAEKQLKRRAHQEDQLKETMEHVKSKHEAEFENMFDKLKQGNQMVDSIDRFLKLSESNDRQKCEKLHSEWEKNVFQKIQGVVGQALDGVDHTHLNKMKRQNFQDFLDAANSKAGLFLDTILDDYDPFKATQVGKVIIPKLRDPSRRILDKHYEEDALIHEKTKEDPKVREILNVKYWGEGQIEATPHGHFAHMMEGPDHVVGELQKKMTRSNVHFDHYDVFKGDCKEYKKGKRIYQGKVNVSTMLLSDAAAALNLAKPPPKKRTALYPAAPGSKVIAKPPPKKRTALYEIATGPPAAPPKQVQNTRPW